MSDIELKVKCKLKKNKRGFVACSGLSECGKQGFGDLEVGTRTRIVDRISRMVVTAVRFKKNRVQLNYCPFCGGDIRTEYPALPEEQPGEQS